jgi:hypothetical protein
MEWGGFCRLEMPHVKRDDGVREVGEEMGRDGARDGRWIN